MVQFSCRVHRDHLTQRDGLGPGGASYTRDFALLMERVDLSDLGEWTCFTVSQ